MDAEIERLKQQKAAEEEYMKMRAIKQDQSLKKKKKKIDPRGEPDTVVRVNVPGKGEQPIIIYEGDRAEDLARDFCIEHLITEQKKQDKLVRVLEHKIEQNKLKKSRYQQSDIANTSKAYSLGSHAFPLSEPDIGITRPHIDPEMKRKIEKMFGKVWLDYDEQNGYLKQEKFKQIMNLIRIYKSIPESNEGFFSDAYLDQAFNKESKILYKGEQRKPGFIRHLGVTQILAQAAK